MSDEQHLEALLATGRWGGRGAGCIVVSKNTGRVLLPLRSDEVLEPGTWGTFGGAVDEAEHPEDAALRELVEETLCDPLDVIELLASHLYQEAGSGFEYHNFIAVVDAEFEPALNWESADAQWFEPGNWPSPLHFGLKVFLESDLAKHQLTELSGRTMVEPNRAPTVFEDLKAMLAKIGEETAPLPPATLRGPKLR